MKLKQKLTASELAALDQYLFGIIMWQDIETLRANPTDFLICSSLHEIYEKTHGKCADLQTFPTRRTDQVYSISISRTQALAFVCSLPEKQPIEETFETVLIKRLVSTIHQTFLI